MALFFFLQASLKIQFLKIQFDVVEFMSCSWPLVNWGGKSRNLSHFLTQLEANTYIYHPKRKNDVLSKRRMEVFDHEISNVKYQVLIFMVFSLLQCLWNLDYISIFVLKSHVISSSRCELWRLIKEKGCIVKACFLIYFYWDG